MAKKGQTFKKYSAEFKLCVILDMREHGLSYRETVRKYELGDNQFGGARHMLQRWERIYLTEGAEGFMVERRGRGSKEKALNNMKTSQYALLCFWNNKDTVLDGAHFVAVSKDKSGKFEVYNMYSSANYTIPASSFGDIIGNGKLISGFIVN